MKYKPYRTVLYIITRIIGYLLYPLPLRVSSRIGSLIGKLVFYIIPKERKKTLTHLKDAFGKEKTEKEIKDIALRLYSNLGKNGLEWLNFPKIDNKWFANYIKTDGLEHISEADKRGKGVIVLASHFGNWELLAAYLGYLGYHGAIIVRKIYIEQFNRFFEKMRKGVGNEVIYRDESPKKVLRVLKDGGFIGLLADQDVSSIEGVFVNFFGRPAYTPVAPIKFAMKSGAALIPMFLVREGGKFKFIVEKEIDVDIGIDKERTLIVNTEKWTKVLEKNIRLYPDHWVWMHRRWKTRPKAVSSEQMQSIDRLAQERFNIPSTRLMENAGKATASIAMDMLELKKDDKKKRVAVFCGKGNNGGDGLVVARCLIEKGLKVTTYLLSGEDNLKKDPLVNFKLLKELNANIITIKENLSSIKDLSGYDLITDAIFGTGFKGKPDDLVSDLINTINQSGAKVLSIDVPSGLDATTGECKGLCIKASETVTFGLPKSGFYKSDGPKFTGRIIVKNIGFPDKLLSNPPSI